MLSDLEIEALIKKGVLKISPFDEKSIRCCKYDIHLGKYLLKPINTSSVLDLSNPDVQPQYEKIDLTKEDFVLEPGGFVLGQTEELIGLDSKVGAFVDGSTTAARLGVTIHQSSTFIPPGQDPHIITLEMFNAGPWKIKLKYKLRIGKLIFFEVKGKSRSTTKQYNRYNGQKETTGAIIKGNNEY